MPAYVINELNSPNTISNTGIIPTRVNQTPDVNQFNFTPLTPATTLSYVTSSGGAFSNFNLTTLIPGAAPLMVGDIVFQFGEQQPTSSDADVGPWQVVTTFAPVYLKELKTVLDISASYGGAGGGGKNWIIFRPNNNVSQIEVYSSSVDGGGYAEEEQPAGPDRALYPPYSGSIAQQPTIVFIYYTNTSGHPLLENYLYSSIPLCANNNRDNCMEQAENPSNPNDIRSNRYIRYKIYNKGAPIPVIPDQPGINYILCNMDNAAQEWYMTFFSMTFR